MDREPDEKVAELKERLARGEYDVDPAAVADAILRRARDMKLLRAQLRSIRRPDATHCDDQAAPGDHTRCSYPRSSSPPSGKLTSGLAAAVAWPIQVIAGLPGRLASALSISSRALGDAQTHSS